MLTSLALYGFLAAGMAACLSLLFALKREVQAVVQTQRAKLEELRQDLSRMAEQLRPQQTEAPAFLTPIPGSGWHLNKRVCAMRMLRRGENSSHIAAALGVPRAEVALLIRVQEISATRAVLGAEAA